MHNPTDIMTKFVADIKEENDKIDEMAAELNKVDSKTNDKMRGTSIITNFTSFAIMHTLDALLLIALLPFMLWQWITTKDKLLAILKVTGEVTLELLMWIIFAGVSVVMAAAFVMEDFYFGKNDSEKLKRTVIIPHEDPLSHADKCSPSADYQNAAREKINITDSQD